MLFFPISFVVSVRAVSRGGWMLGEACGAEEVGRSVDVDVDAAVAFGNSPGTEEAAPTERQPSPQSASRRRADVYSNHLC